MKKFLFLLLFSSAAFADYFGSGGNTLGLSCAGGEIPAWGTTGFTVCGSATGTGSVTSVGLLTDSTTSAVLANTANAVTGSPITGSGSFTLTFKTQVANKVLAGPTTGSAAAPTYRLLVGADLPNPSSSTLGGVESIAAVSSNFLTAISTSGVPSQAQPAFTDISGTAATAQIANNAVTLAKLATQADQTILGNNSGGAAVPSALSTSTVLSMLGALASTGFIEEWVVNAQGANLANGTYYVVPFAALGRKVVTVRAACATSGTVTVDLKIGGTNITTCNGISVTSTPATTTCDTGSTSTLAANGILTLVTTSNSSCTDFYANVKTTRQ